MAVRYCLLPVPLCKFSISTSPYMNTNQCMMLMITLYHNCSVVVSGEFMFPLYISLFFLHWFLQFALCPSILVFNSPVIPMVIKKRTILRCGSNPSIPWRVSVLIMTVKASTQESPLDNWQSFPETNNYHDKRCCKKTWQQDLQLPIWKTEYFVPQVTDQN